MVKIRITADIILDTTDKITAQQTWDKLKLLMPKLKQISQTVEKSTITVHKCFHDSNPPRKCEEIKRIVMQDTELDEVL